MRHVPGPQGLPSEVIPRTDHATLSSTKGTLVRIVADSPMDRIRRIPDPRDPRGRRHRLPGLVGMMLMGAMQGERNLAGMWRWGASHWSHLVRPLDLWGTPNPPTLETVMKLCRLLDPAVLSEALGVSVPTAVPDADEEEQARHDEHKAQIRQILRAAGRRYKQSMELHPMYRFDYYEALASFLCELPLKEILGEPPANTSPVAHNAPADSGVPRPQPDPARAPYDALPPRRGCPTGVFPQQSRAPLSEIQIMPDHQMPERGIL